MAEARAPHDSNRTPPVTESEASRPVYIQQDPSGQTAYTGHPSSGLVSCVEGQPVQYYPPVQNAPQPSRPMCLPPQGSPPGISLSFDIGALLRTQVGCIKILEFFVLATAWAAALKYNAMFDKTDDSTSFFLGATICAWAVTILCIVNTIFGGTRDLCNPMDYTRFIINIYVVLDIVIAVSSSLMAERAKHWASMYHDYPELHSNIISLYVAVGFGFLSFFVILVDLVTHCNEYSFYKQQAPSGYQQFQNQLTFTPPQHSAQSDNRHPAAMSSFPAPE